MTDPKGFYAALRDFRDAVQSISGAYVVIVGGLAVQEHGYARWTEDIGAIADSAHFSELIERLREKGFELTPQKILKHRATGIELDLLREGTQLSGARGALPPPQELGSNLGFAHLNGLIRLKLLANRVEDQADVSRLLKAHPGEWARIRANLPVEFQADFDRIAEDAQAR